jgi:hypothetical protein
MDGAAWGSAKSKHFAPGIREQAIQTDQPALMEQSALRVVIAGVLMSQGEPGNVLLSDASLGLL